MIDITEFMTWFITQVINIFTAGFNILNNITFAGTSLLKINLAILFFSAAIPVILTIANSGLNKANTLSEKVDRNTRRRK